MLSWDDEYEEKKMDNSFIPARGLSLPGNRQKQGKLKRKGRRIESKKKLNCPGLRGLIHLSWMQRQEGKEREE